MYELLFIFIYLFWTSEAKLIKMLKPFKLNPLITTNFLGVRIFRNFTVLYIKVGTVTVYHLIFTFFFLFYNLQLAIYNLRCMIFLRQTKCVQMFHDSLNFAVHQIY